MTATPFNVRAQRRMLLVASVTLYVGFFIATYIGWVSPRYAYLGMHYRASWPEVVSASLVCIAVSFVLPGTIKMYSHFFTWMVYLATYIPSVLALGMQGYSSFNAPLLILALTISLLLASKIPELVRGAPAVRVRRLNKRSFFVLFFLVYLALLGYFLYSFRGLMSFAFIDEIYEQRGRLAEAGIGGLALYSMFWLSNTFNPYLVGVGLMDTRHRSWMVIGVLGQLLCYMAFAGKIMLSMVLVMFAFRYLVFTRGQISVPRISLGFLALASTTFFILLSYEGHALAEFMSAMLFMRTLAIQGAMTGVYADFFAMHPYTYYSHTNVVSAFIQYPYAEPLGIVIGADLVGGAGFNANANFWATDGIAGFGTAGVILIGVVLGLLLTLANRLFAEERLTFAALISLPFIMSIGNASLFTNLITGGGLLTALLIIYGLPWGNGIRRSGIAGESRRRSWRGIARDLPAAQA